MAADGRPVIDRTASIIGSVACFVLVSGFVALTVGGFATEAYVLFVSGPVVSGVVGVVLSKKVNAVQATADVVQEHVNGMMSGRFDAIDTSLTEATVQRVEIAEQASPTAAGGDTAGASDGK